MKRVGIIGCGGIAQVHGWVLSEMDDVEIAAVCDLQRDRAESFLASQGCKSAKERGETGTQSPESASGHAGCRVETDWRRLRDMELDVVHICTPHDLHVPMAVELLKSGKAVFMEKPCAISREQFEELYEADGAHPGKLGICFQNRYNETTKLADELIAANRIGKVIGARAFVTWRRDAGYYQGSAWKGKKSTEGGGALINQSIHTLDLLLRYLGKPVKVRASLSNHHLPGIIEVEDTVEAWMEFEGGGRACFYASNGYACDAPVLLEIQGEKGRITIDDQEVRLQTNGVGTERFDASRSEGIGKSYWGVGHKACIRDFYDSLEKGKNFPVDLASIETTFDTMMRIYESV